MKKRLKLKTWVKVTIVITAYMIVLISLISINWKLNKVIEKYYNSSNTTILINE